MLPFAAALFMLIASTGASPRVPPTVAAQANTLRIVVIEGEDAVNIVQQKTAVAPVVEVRDRNNQPVAGAIVRFAIQQGRGTFAGARTLSVTTNAAGRAVAAGLTPTGSGALQIGASATFQGQTAVATIAQTNVMTAAQAAAASGRRLGNSGTRGRRRWRRKRRRFGHDSRRGWRRGGGRCSRRGQRVGGWRGSE